MTSTAYTTFSSVNFRYFDFSPISEGYSLKGEKVLLSNGLRLNIFDALYEPKDFSFNKKSGLVLTNYYTNSSIFLNDEISEEIEFEEIYSPLTNIQSLIITSSANALYKTDRYAAYTDDIIHFKKTDDYFEIINKDSFYLTYNAISPLLEFKPKIIPNSVLQKFEYFLNKNILILFPYGTNKSKVVVSTNPLSVSSYNFNTFFNNISSYSLKLYSFQNNQTFSKNQNSYLAEYNNDVLNVNNILETKDNSSKENYSQNYLILFPYEYQKNEKYPFYVHALKNYQTPEYDYSKGANYYNNSQWNRRNYDQIFTGTNQYGGYNNVFLGYRGKTQKLTFSVDKETKFFYPVTSPKMSIHDSGLIEDGAKSGEVPFESDRVYVQNVDHSKTFLANSEYITKFDGTWACAWLSGNGSGDSIWMDRFYNAAYYSLDQALSAQDKVFNPKQFNVTSNILDVSSNLYFEPGLRYSYFRCGDTQLSDYSESFDFDYNADKGAKLLHIKKWNSTPLKDESPYQHNALTFYDKSSNFKDEYWVLDGSNHAVISTDDVLLNNNHFTANIWVNVNDWKNIQGEQIFGNYYNGGYGLINSSSLTAPLLTVSENVNGNFVTFNYRFLSVNSTNATPLTDQENRIIQKLQNFDYWVFDCVNLIARKYDVEGKLIDAIPASVLDSYITQIDQVEIDQYENLYILDKSNKKVIKLDSGGNYVSNTTITGQSFQINKNNVLVDCYGNLSAIDSSNNVWEVVGGNLYKNQQIYGNLGNVYQICFDVNDNLWILHEQDSISKLNTIDNKFEFTLRAGTRSSISEDPCIISLLPKNFRTMDFVKVPTSTGSEDLAVIVDIYDNEIYLINQIGQMTSKLNLASLSTAKNFQYYAEGDFTGYQYLRKYGYTNKNLSWKFKISKPDNSSEELKELVFSTTNLHKGWHLFSFAFDTTEGKAYYYVDSILVDSLDFPKNEYVLNFEYKSSLLIGANTLKNKILNDVINVNNGYKFIGSVSDLSVYSKKLTQQQIRALYHTSNFSPSLESLNWNLPTGERNFIECVDKWYKMQITGNKSKFFNIKLHNLNIEESLKPIVENSLKNVIKKIIPSYNSLNKIEWL